MDAHKIRRWWEQKKGETYALVGLVAAFASWGYTALVPEPDVRFGFVLVGLAFSIAAFLVCRLLEFRRVGVLISVVVTFALFWSFWRNVVVTPRFKRQMLSQLQRGYGLRGECGNRGYYDETPAWMRDSQEQWKTNVADLLGQAGNVEDVQLWHNSQIVGLVSQGNMNGFRCTEIAVKVGALESIVSAHYDPTIKASPYTGPVYVMPRADAGPGPR